MTFKVRGGVSMSRSLRRTRLFSVVCICLTFAYLYIAHFAYDALTLPNALGLTTVPSGTYEDIAFPSRGQGYDVHAFFLPGKPGSPAVIVVHGYRNSRHDDLELQMAEALRELGYSVLVPDLGGHGGDTVGIGRIGMGLQERWDVLGGFDYLIMQGFTPARIGLIGTSLGAASVLMAAQVEPRVCTVWADSAYARTLNVVVDSGIQGGYAGLIVPLIPGGLLYGWMVSGDRLWEANPIDAANALAANHTAIYLVHDEKDTTVPFYHSQMLRDAFTQAGVKFTFWDVPDLDHIEAFTVHRTEYLRRLDGFLRAHLQYEL
jgi:dipeptidyl aminopeptidase/acylaminoacyl peptidase